MIKHKFILAMLISINMVAYSQYGENIRSGRPGQAIGAFAVGKNIFQIQSGMDVTQSNYESLGFSETYNNYLFNNILRYGITEKFELGLGVNFQYDQIESDLGNSSNSGISGISIRMRSNVIEGNGLKPTLGYQFNLSLPFGSEGYKTEDVIPKITFMTSQSLSEKIGLSTNFGFKWIKNEKTPTKFYIINLGYSISKKWSCFVENYGFLKSGDFDSRFDGGIAYLVNSNLQLDFFSGYDKISNNLDELFISVGISWRTARK